MSFARYKKVIEMGDLVILYINFNTMYPVYVTETVLSKKGVEVEHVFQTKYGGLKVPDLVGKKFGTKVQLTRGYAYALHPTPELWTKTLPHRTQILYATDISMILVQLELRPGSVVVESGTGSASLSHSILRTIAPSGHLYTFDFHEQRVETAKQEFNKHGLGDKVTCVHRDVCGSGFNLENKADAVFLDLPHPWEAVPHAKAALKATGGRVCAFSPCIEQVQKTCESLKACGFNEISTLVCLLREFQVKKITLPEFDPEFEAFDNQNGVVGHKRKHEDNGDDKDKKPRDEIKDSEVDPKENATPVSDVNRSERNPKPPVKEIKFVSGIPLTNMPGHTSYLTFATLPTKLQSHQPPSLDLKD